MAKTTEKKKDIQTEVNETLWRACDTFRGVVDSDGYKRYILAFLFLKYLSDVWKDHEQEYRKRYGDDDELIQRKLSRERFFLPKNCTFDYLVEHKKDPDIGDKINKVMARIEEANKLKLDRVFRGVDYNSENLGQSEDKNRRLQNLINDFCNPKLDFRPSVVGTEDIIGNAYMYLIEKFASGGGKKGGEFFTPAEVSELLARLMNPQPGAKICDPTCGSGSLLIKVAEQVEGRNFAIYGQESNGDTWSLCKMNMFLHSMDSARIEWGDTLNQPRLVEEKGLMQFDIVVANPPFSLDKWGHENALNDMYKRYWRERTVPPRTKADFAFIIHMLETALKGKGKVGIIIPHGVLFRGGAEETIRKHIIAKEKLLEAVIGLPTNLFFGTGIPAAILIFNKAKENKKVIFIDASKEYEPGKKQNKLREEDIKKIVKTYQSFKTIDKYSYVADLSEIEQNGYNLNIPRYVDTFEEEAPIDIKATQKEIDKLEKELAAVQKEMSKYLKELGF